MQTINADSDKFNFLSSDRNQQQNALWLGQTEFKNHNNGIKGVVSARKTSKLVVRVNTKKSGENPVVFVEMLAANQEAQVATPHGCSRGRPGEIWVI